MCGIAGIYSENNAIDRPLDAMTASMIHRGPDEAGTYISGPAGLGQRRLSIIDLATGRQPIMNEDNTLSLVCNGEIYNSPELRQSLIEKGHSFRTKTDVEVILHLYEETGKECVDKLRGMFAFAIWDSRRREFFLARDHLGQKPLFYYHDSTTFIFASEVKALLASGCAAADFDLEAIWHYVTLRFVPDDRTFFKGIKKLPAASRMTYGKEGPRVERYWELDFSNKFTGTEDEIIEGLRDAVEQSVKLHLLSDVRVGAFVSGGIDSSLVAAIMARSTKEKIPTFSIGVSDAVFNELPFAQMVSEAYSTEHHTETVSADIVHQIPFMVWHMDEPSDPFGLGMHLVSRLTRRHVKVALGGDGGDELFAGYDRFAGNRLVDYYAFIPEWLRKNLVPRLISCVPVTFGYKTLSQKLEWANTMSLIPDAGRRYAESLGFLRFYTAIKNDLFSKSAQSSVLEHDSASKIMNHYNAHNADNPIDKMLYTDIMTRLPDHLLVIADRMSMAHSLEARCPYVDKEIAAYAARIPAELKVKRATPKYCLREAASPYLPQTLVSRKKQGFGFPIAQWLRTDLRKYVLNLMKDSAFVKNGVFDPACIQTIVNEHLEGRKDHNFRLWILINLEMLERLHIQKKTLGQAQEYTERLMKD